MNAPKSRKGTRRQAANKKKKKKYIENPRPTIASIKKQESWIDITDIWFRETFEDPNTKFVFKINGDEYDNVSAPRSKKLKLAGNLHGVLTKYDARNGNQYKPELLDYERFSDFKYISFNFKSAIQDPYILEFANRSNANIFTTENVMTSIMCCNRSKYSFDIVINKIGNKIFLDERSKVLSVMSVDETSQHRPTKKGTFSKINWYQFLAQEATYINHVFTEQMVFHSNERYVQRLKPHPFLNEVNNSGSNAMNKKNKNNKQQQQQQQIGSNAQQSVSSKAFSYNQYDVTDNISVICRCSIDGYIVRGTGSDSSQKKKDWVKIYALNQYDPNKSRTTPWIKHLDTKDSSILYQEITNNNFKCARWAINAHLSDAKYIKLGFICRSDVHSTERHLIVGVKTYETDDFIKNKVRIRSVNEVWTIFAKFIKCIQDLEKDGRYIAVRDPLKQYIRIYKVSDDSFTKDDGLPSFGYLKKVLNINDK